MSLYHINFFRCIFHFIFYCIEAQLWCVAALHLLDESLAATKITLQDLHAISIHPLISGLNLSTGPGTGAPAGVAGGNPLPLLSPAGSQP